LFILLSPLSTFNGLFKCLIVIAQQLYLI
jgi:hypothetical protein